MIIVPPTETSLLIFFQLSWVESLEHEEYGPTTFVSEKALP